MATSAVQPFTAARLRELRNARGMIGFSKDAQSPGRFDSKHTSFEPVKCMTEDMLDFASDELMFLANIMEDNDLTYANMSNEIVAYLVASFNDSYPAPSGSASRWNCIASASTLEPRVNAANGSVFWAKSYDPDFEVLIYRSQD